MVPIRSAQRFQGREGEGEGVGPSRTGGGCGRSNTEETNGCRRLQRILWKPEAANMCSKVWPECESMRFWIFVWRAGPRGGGGGVGPGPTANQPPALCQNLGGGGGRSDPTQHAKGRTRDCPGPRKGATTQRNVTRGALGGGGGVICFFSGPSTGIFASLLTERYLWSCRPRAIFLSALCADRVLCSRTIAQHSFGGSSPQPSHQVSVSPSFPSVTRANVAPGHF